MTDDRYSNGHAPDEAPPDEVLEAEAEGRSEQQAEHERYMTWLTERAARAMDVAAQEASEYLAAHDEADPDVLVGEGEDALDTVTLDLRDVAPRNAYELADITGEMDAADLLALDLPAIRHVVPGVLPEGTTILVAPPKIGKSILCYQLAVECALGGEFLGRSAAKGSVLYLALEDGKRRAQSRLVAALDGRSKRRLRGRLSLRWDAPSIGDGLEGLIEEWLERHADAVLVIIDTLGKVRKGNDGRRNAYEVDVEDLGRLQNLFRDKQGVALVIVHHTAKRNDYDFVAQVSGTYGIPGSADTIITIVRQRLAEVATLAITGREIAEAELAVRFSNMHWEAAPEVVPGMTAERMAVYDGVKLHGPIMPLALGRELRMQRTAVQHHVDGLVSDGLIIRLAAGYIVNEDTLARDDDNDETDPQNDDIGSTTTTTKVSRVSQTPIH